LFIGIGLLLKIDQKMRCRMKKKIIGILKDNIDNPEKSEAGMIKKNVWFYRNKPDKFIYFCQNKLG